MNESLQQQLAGLVSSNRVVLFMKGTRDAPTCGFSAKVVQTLNALIADYETVNVLNSPEIREGIKQFSGWPTIPQLYVDGKLVGGCDIVVEMNAKGSLQELLKIDPDTSAQLAAREVNMAKVCRCSDKKSAASDKREASP